MSRNERFYLIDQLLSSRKRMTRQELLDALEISWATLKRDLAFLRDRFNAPIIFDKEAGGYRFGPPSAGPIYELPGLWFSGQETYALMTMHHLLEELEPGLLAPHVQPLLSRLETILSREKLNFSEVATRIHLMRIGRRRQNAEHFAVVAQAVLEQRQIQVRHYSREKDDHSERRLSPQRLVNYRNNWYVEAWCHAREALRRFSVDALQGVELLTLPSRVISVADLDTTYGSSYGIYGGAETQVAILRFSPAATRWVEDEEWHPEQVGSLDENGCYVLRVPYADPTELKMDILRHGHHVEVMEPAALRDAIRDEIARMARVYP